MEGKGDGSHIGNHPGFPFPLSAAGDRHYGGLLGVLEFLLNQGLEQVHFFVVVDLLNELDEENADDGDIDENPNNDEMENNNEDQEDHNQDDDNHGNIDNNENCDNNDNVNNDNNDNIVNIVNIDNNSNHNRIDNNDGINNDNVGDNVYNRNIDNNNEDAEVAGCSAWVDFGVNQGDEFAESRTDFNGFNKKTGNSPIEHVKVPEEDPMPGPSKKRTRKTNREDDERSSKKSRQCHEFTESNSDTVTITTGNDLPHSSGNIEVSEAAGAAGETDKEEKEKDSHPGSSKERLREDDEEEDIPDSKRFKR